MTVLGWVLPAVVGWILLSALAVAVWAWLGRWHNRHLAPLSADPIGLDFDEHIATAGVLCDDSRIMARWCDQPTIDRLFAGMVAVHRSQVHNHTDKEN